MKYYLTSFFICYTLLAFAQKQKVNNINQVKSLNIYGNGNKTVIGKLIVNQTLQTKIFLINSYQTKDTLGIYTTTINIGNKENVPLFGGDYSLEFDTPVISAEGKPQSMGMDISTTLNEAHTNFSYKIGQVNRPWGGGYILLSFVIKSTRRTLVTIKGIDGILKN
jgi:hypothetical protein